MQLILLFLFQFDVLVVSIGLVSFLHAGAEVAKIFRTLRVCRLIRTSMQFRMLLSTVISSVGAILEIAALMFVILFSFAFVGMQVFEGTTDSLCSILLVL